MNTIQEQWEDFSKKAIPETAPYLQVLEMKKAFYAGAYGAITVMVKIGCDDVSEEAGVKIFESIKTECELFALSGVC